MSTLELKKTTICDLTDSIEYYDFNRSSSDQCDNCDCDTGCGNRFNNSKDDDCQ